MAVAFPLSLAAFFDLLPIASCSVSLTGGVQVSQTRGGELLQAELGVRLWQGDVTLRSMSHTQARPVIAALDLLSGAGGSFMFSPWPDCFPASDAGGEVIAGSSPTLQTIAANSRELRIAGLPNGYKIEGGTFLSFAYGSNPVRYAMHKVAVGGQASSGGLTPLIEVVPPIRQGAATGAAVKLSYPMIKAQLVPSATKFGTPRGNRREGVSFKFIQTLR